MGTVGPPVEPRPELAGQRLRALRELRGPARPFVVRLYDSYSRVADGDALPRELASQIAAYGADGFDLELVLRYRPADQAGDVAGFAKFVRARVRELALRGRLASLQVANEANVRGAPDSADGAYRRVEDALVTGAIAASEEARRGGCDGLRIGFNWAYGLGDAEAAFFSRLGALGGAAFASSVDWVGIDAYPATWGPPLAGGELAAAARSATLAALRTLRETLLPLAGLSAPALHFSESGYPTGPGRSELEQETVLRAVVGAVVSARRRFGVTDFRWFSLRDADSANPSLESRYGLLRDDYSAKRAFFAYRSLVSQHRPARPGARLYAGPRPRNRPWAPDAR